MPQPPIAEDFQLLVHNAQVNELEELGKQHMEQRRLMEELRKAQHPGSITASDLLDLKSKAQLLTELDTEINRIDKEADAAAAKAEETTNVQPGERFPAPTITVK